LLQLLPAAAQASPATPTEYRDTAFAFGTVYLYSVRSVISYGADQVESDDSNLVTVNAKDIFPPAAPQSFVAVVTPAANGMPAYVELTWGINSESDLAGYVVYRSDAAGTLGQRVNPQLLPAPTYRDDSVQPGRRYFYHVTAVDQAGNESTSSTVVDVALP
jgi:fibronectin type 3 domain-containing protein